MSSNMQAAVLDRFEEPLLNRKGTPANGKMHAAVVEQFGKALLLQELDIPSPGAGPDTGEDGGLRRLPHRSPCRAW